MERKAVKEWYNHTMNSGKDWLGEYQRELATAKKARDRGNEGMARVCARRAANIVIGEYLLRQGYRELSGSVIDKMAIFDSLEGLDAQSKEIASHFLLKVNAEHKLPVQADLVGEVEWLMNKLLLENFE